MEKYKEVIPQELRVVALDETGDWTEEVRTLAGTIYGIYLYDSTEVTHLCEVTPSYHLRRVATEYSNFLAEKDREAMDGYIWDCMRDDQDMYLHCSDVDKLPFETISMEGEYSDYADQHEPAEAYERFIEEGIDRYNSNPHLPGNVTYNLETTA